jgi:hypothetical protein
VSAKLETCAHAAGVGGRRFRRKALKYNKILAVLDLSGGVFGRGLQRVAASLQP